MKGARLAPLALAMVLVPGCGYPDGTSSEIRNLQLSHDAGRIVGSFTLDLHAPSGEDSGDLTIYGLELYPMSEDSRSSFRDMLADVHVDPAPFPVHLMAGASTQVQVRFDALSPLAAGTGIASFCSMEGLTLQMNVSLYDSARDSEPDGENGVYPPVQISAPVLPSRDPKTTFEANWSLAYGSTAGDGMGSPAVDGAGNVYVISYGNAAVHRDPALTMIDPTGKLLWSAATAAYRVAAREDVVVAWSGSVVRYGSDGMVLWNRSVDAFGIPGLAVGSGGETVIAGTASNGPFRVTKLDASGGKLYETDVAKSGGRDPQATTDSTGAAIVTAWSGEWVASKTQIAKLDTAGKVLWEKTIDDAAVTAVTTDSADRVLLAGRLSGPADFGGGPMNAGAFVVALDPAGAHVWSRGFGIGAVTPTGLAADGAGHIMVAGAVEPEGSIDFGSGPIGAKLVSVLFAARLDASGSIVHGDAVGCGDIPWGTGAFLRKEIDVVYRGGQGDFVLAGTFFDALGVGKGRRAVGGSDAFLASLPPGG